MTVESYLELYLTMFGWRQYANIWDILTTTRLIYLPIIAIIFTNITQPLMSQEAKNAVITSVKRMEIQIFIAIAVIVLAGVPFMTLNAGPLKYTKPCDTAFGLAKTVQAGSTGTTYDVTFADMVTTSVKVPIWWRFFMSVFSGFNRQAIAGIGCTTDLTGYRLRLDKQRVVDPALAREVQQFVMYCYAPSISKWQRDGLSILRDHPSFATDTTHWIGSQAFLDIPGFYDARRPQEGIGGWPYDPSRDTEYPPELVNQYDTANIGRPLCKEWWMDSNKGLKTRLLASVEHGLLDDLRSVLPTAIGGLTPEQVDEKVLKSVVETTLAVAPHGADFVPSLNSEDAFSLERFGAGLGLDIEEFSFAPLMYAVRTALPIIQALILGAMYALVGIVLVAGGLNFSSVIGLTLAIFTVKFWSSLWHLAWFLEQGLLLILYPDIASYGQASSMATLSSNYILGGDFALKMQTLQYATALMYIVFPMIFSFLLGLVGIGAIGGLTMLAGAALSPIQAASRKGTDTAKTAGSAAASRGMSTK